MHAHFFLAMLALLAGLMTAPAAQARIDQQTVAAIRDCLRQINKIVGTRKPAGKDVACNIPVVLKERDLDEVFRAALRTAAISDKWRGFAHKYSTGITKAVTNFRAANCQINIRVQRRKIINALEANETTVQLDKQPVNCSVTTRKRMQKPLSFSFSPRVEMKRGCVETFALNMGDIDADCRVCMFSRLYLATRLVSIWANHMSGNVSKTLNNLLGGSCRK